MQEKLKMQKFQGRRTKRKGDGSNSRGGSGGQWTSTMEGVAIGRFEGEKGRASMVGEGERRWIVVVGEGERERALCIWKEKIKIGLLFL